MEINKCCRICLRETKPQNTIYEHVPCNSREEISYVDLLKTLPKIKFNDNAELPSIICRYCMIDLNFIYSFLVKVEKTQSILGKAESLRKHVQDIDSDNDSQMIVDYRTADSTVQSSSDSNLGIKIEVEDSDDDDCIEIIPTHSDFEPESQLESANADIKEEPELDLQADSENLSSDDTDIDIKIETVMIDLEEKETYSLDRIESNALCMCSSCGTNFTTAERLEQHMEICSMLHECPACLIVFQDRTRFIDHLKREHPSDRNLFKITHLEDESKPSLSDGEENIKAKISIPPAEAGYGKVLVCSYCPKVFKKESRLRGHMAVHLRHYRCKPCCKSFRSSNHLKAHNMRVHGIDWKQIECGVCNKFFACRADLLRHQLTHTKEKPYRCKWCAVCVRYKRFLESHMRQTHDVSEDEIQNYMKEKYGSIKFEFQLTSTFTCNVCGLEVDRNLLAAHVNSHKGKKPIKKGIKEEIKEEIPDLE